MLDVLRVLGPESVDIWTLAHRPGAVDPLIESRLKGVAWGGRLGTHPQRWLPLLPFAARSLPLRGYDLVVSITHTATLWAHATDNAATLSYCLSPSRWAGDLRSDYLPGLRGVLASPFLGVWRRAEAWATFGVNRFAGISRHVSQRIWLRWGRPADVVYPTVDLTRFSQAWRWDRGFWLLVSALVPYKRVDLAIGAANMLGARLSIVGTGRERRRLQRMAGPTVHFLGGVSDAHVARLYRHAHGLIFPGVEDFGITNLEAMAAGLPVVAYASGGALETLTDETAEWFHQPTAASLAEAMLRADRRTFDPAAARARAEQFGPERFRRDFLAWIGRGLARDFR